MDITTSDVAGFATFAAGIIYICVGLNGIFRPLNMLHFFGLSTAAKSPTSTHIMPAFGGRNLAGGLAITIFSLTHRRTAAGLLLACWTPNGLIDAYVVHKHGEKVVVHLMNTVAVALIAALALVEGQGEKWVDRALVGGLVGMIGVITVHSWVWS
ncbi:hypothetical protein PMZ80_007622 [Knufia obscura]|uniref:Uncharacterized protein n=1 Tax=Knufia obscura TaxID=1635080 RepID=A0ABR0RHT6_9EURO|nr:hypothetical protein PMZ80_007622 [Knufia obscura]